jgi:hypothetical protein
MPLRISGLLLGIAFLASAQEKPETEDEKPVLPVIHTTIVITAQAPNEPTVDRRNAEVFSRTLFSRDDQIFQVLDAGINAGQHEGGGKSLEIRRFGFNLDHGGVNGGLKVLIDDVQQNQGTQGHGQGYLGSLKSLSPELVEEVNIINGPFSAEYGDFSGLGVVHIRLRESFPYRLTARIQGGSFGTERAFLGWSPNINKVDSFLAYEGSHTDGPFLSPLRYTRHNVTANYGRHLTERRSVGFKFNGGLNDFYSSGQLPLDQVASGALDRFGFIDPTDGGRVQAATAAVYYRQEGAAGDVFKVDGFVGRSLLDLFSNFTFFLNDPVHGDAFQQHDSRLQEGANAQYLRPHKVFGAMAVFTAGTNYHDNQINVGLYSRDGRVPVDTLTRALARVTNEAGYAQETLSVWHNRIQMTGGLRYDEFRFRVNDVVRPDQSGVESAGNWQPKASLSFTPTQRFPLTLYLNYGRGISTADARGIVEHPELPRVATTDFYQFGTSYRYGRLSFSNDFFWIDRSNEQVYIPDDGSFEFKGPSRSYGFETKASLEITRKLSLNGGLTKVANAFYRGSAPRLYVDSAPHFVANAGLTLSSWRGWIGSLRMRAIDHYRLDDADPGVVASGQTVFDFGLSRTIRHGVEFNATLDNALDRAYYETQNYFESRLAGQDPRFRIHGTPGYPRTFMAGLTFRLFEK